MYKTIKNIRSNTIHAAYDCNSPVTFCGAINYYSDNVYVQRYTTIRLRNNDITCGNCLRMLGTYRKTLPFPPSMTMNNLAACRSNITDNIKTFMKLSLDCDHRVTDRLEPTYRCCHEKNKIGTCEWVFCPLEKEIG